MRSPKHPAPYLDAMTPVALYADQPKHLVFLVRIPKKRLRQIKPLLDIVKDIVSGEADTVPVGRQRTARRSRRRVSPGPDS